MSGNIFNICILNRQFFGEIGETLCYGLKELGLNAYLHENAVVEGAINIFLGAHLLKDAQVISKDSIVFNLEQLTSGTAALTYDYKRLLGMQRVLDYSQRNVDHLRAAGVAPEAKKISIGFNPFHQRISAVVPDIDVLFYGVVSPRREHVLNALRGSGLRVTALTGVYGSELDNYIARSKVVLNVHCYESHVFEIVRASYLLNNGKAVVTEYHEDTDIDADLRSAVWLTPYKDLTEACIYLVNHEEIRFALEREALTIFKQRSQASFLRGALQDFGLI